MIWEALEEYLGDASAPFGKRAAGLLEQVAPEQVVICPGGGHHILAYDLEGTEVAEWLAATGVTGIVLSQAGVDRGAHHAVAPDRFGQHLTVKGDGKINVNTAERRVLEALIQRFVIPPPNDDYVDTLIQKINEFRNTPPLLGGGVFRNGEAFKAILEANLLNGFEVDPAITNALDVKSKIFRVTSVGEVGKAQVAIEVIIDFDRSSLGQITSWRRILGKPVPKHDVFRGYPPREPV